MKETWEKVTKNEKGQTVRIDRSDGSFTKYDYHQNGKSLTFERSDGYDNNPLQIKHSTGLIQNWFDNKWVADNSER